MSNIENESRAQFEEAYTAYCSNMGWKIFTAFHMLSEVYVNESTELAWQMWQASRQALVIEMPDLVRPSADGMGALFACRAAIESQGVKCK